MIHRFRCYSDDVFNYIVAMAEDLGVRYTCEGPMVIVVNAPQALVDLVLAHGGAGIDEDNN